MLYIKKRLKNPSSTNKEENKAVTIDGKEVSIITVFTDIDVAIVEDKDGNIFDVKRSNLLKS